MLPGLPAPLRFPANPAFHTGLKSKAPGVCNTSGAFWFRDTLNKLLNASAFPPSFLRKQEPKNTLNKSLDGSAFTPSFLRKQEPETL